MNDKKIRSLGDVRIFLAGTLELECSIQDKDARYDWIEQTLQRFIYRILGRKETDRRLLAGLDERHGSLLWGRRQDALRAHQ